MSERHTTRAARRRELHLARIQAATTPAGRLSAAVDYLRAALARRPAAEVDQVAGDVAAVLIEHAEQVLAKGTPR